VKDNSSATGAGRSLSLFRRVSANASLSDMGTAESCSGNGDRSARVAELRARVLAQIAAKGEARVAPNPPPRYDDVYYEGLDWLEGLP
jgi:hypothetical protein